MAQMHEIKGWCPTAYRPMATGDGLLLRLTPKWTGLSPYQLLAIAETALEFGNGLIDLTQRANIQIRGIAPDHYSKALSALITHELIEAKDASSLQANILISPLSHLKKNKLNLTAHEFAAELNSLLLQNNLTDRLPSKFLFCINDCATLSLYTIKSDILIDLKEDGKTHLILANDYQNPILIEQKDCLISVIALTQRFLELSKQDQFLFRRLHALIDKIGINAFIEPFSFKTTHAYEEFKPKKDAYLGEINFNHDYYIGVSAPSGSWTADKLKSFSQILINHQSQNIRPTPWRSLLIPVHDVAQRRQFFNEMNKLNLIISQDDPRLALIACPGAPKCSQAYGKTDEVLERLSSYAPDISSYTDISVHISGCTKGCVKGDETPLTITLTDQGYNLIQNGRADGEAIFVAQTLDELDQYIKNNPKILEPL